MSEVRDHRGEEQTRVNQLLPLSERVFHFLTEENPPVGVSVDLNEGGSDRLTAADFCGLGIGRELAIAADGLDLPPDVVRL